MAPQCGYPRLAHPFGSLDLSHIRLIVSPRFPIRNKEDPVTLLPPDLPYTCSQFDPDEERHSDDIKPVFSVPYYGCLPCKQAFQFQRIFSSLLCTPLPCDVRYLYGCPCTQIFLHDLPLSSTLRSSFFVMPNRPETRTQRSIRETTPFLAFL